MKILFSQLFCIVAVFLLFISTNLHATHIKAGEITVENNSSLSYNFTLTLYLNTDDNAVDQKKATLNFGDNTNQEVGVESSTKIDDNTKKNVYKFSHDYSGSGIYKISFKEENRNAGVLNMDNSVNTSFYIETQILADPFLSGNKSPKLTVPPIDKGNVGELYTHNPGAWDPNGDSLSYQLVKPKQNNEETVDGYQNPSQIGNGQSINGGPPFFKINNETGQITWNTPAEPGLYNVAFKIIEWRNGTRLGYVTRDMQIEINKNSNEVPEVIVPNDTCIIAGETLNDTILGDDPDNDLISLSGFGGIYEVKNPATNSFKKNNPQPVIAKLFFNWKTQCSNIRKRPYQATFKAIDDGTNAKNRQLANLKTWKIKVIGPPPKNLKANAQGNEIKLNWDKYNCNNSTNNVPANISIWRRKGNSDWSPDSCEVGIPSIAGYKKIGEVKQNKSSFIDSSNLQNAVNYCYRIVAEFPDPKGGKSIASNEACEKVKFNSPVITNVSVMNTDTQNGKIKIMLAKPLEIDKNKTPPPYKYEYYRVNPNGEDNLIFSGNSINDTIFIDSSNNLNTKENQYTYYVKFLFGENYKFSEKTDSASSVRLNTTGISNKVALKWKAEVPWINTTRYHYIYRQDNNGNFNLIDSIFTRNNNFSYTDDGSSTGITLKNGTEYCYYVTTKGSYENNKIRSPLFNNSQIKCEKPKDTIAPCPPELSLNKYPCDSLKIIENQLYWNNIRNKTCDSGISNYKIYYSKHRKSNTSFIKSTQDTFYIHENIDSRAACYQVTAIDEFGNESDKSNKVCIESCIEYNLPNVITPNNDGINEVFEPKENPVFVNDSHAQIYNRWGKRIYTTSDKNINWNGVDQSGSKVPSGIYYYKVKVTFKTLEKDPQPKVYKGWIQLLR